MPDTKEETENFSKLVSKRLIYALGEKEARDAIKIGNNELARLADVAAGKVSKILTRKQKIISFQDVWKLSQALGVRLEWLATGEGSPWVQSPPSGKHAISQPR